jgi:hypothetical protein
MAKAKKNHPKKRVTTSHDNVAKKDNKDITISTDLSFEDMVKMSMQQPPKKKKPNG